MKRVYPHFQRFGRCIKMHRIAADCTAVIC